MFPPAVYENSYLHKCDNRCFNIFIFISLMGSKENYEMQIKVRISSHIGWPFGCLPLYLLLRFTPFFCHLVGSFNIIVNT